MTVGSVKASTPILKLSVAPEPGSMASRTYTEVYIQRSRGTDSHIGYNFDGRSDEVAHKVVNLAAEWPPTVAILITGLVTHALTYLPLCVDLVEGAWNYRLNICMLHQS